MKISKKLPQFEGFPVLFVVSGEYEALFYVAQDGNIDLIRSIKKSPREDAHEKQAFVGKKSGMFGPVAVSHHGAYIEDLKLKFARNVHSVIHDIIATYKLKEIYLFAPRYASQRIMKGLSVPEKEKIRMRFFGEYTKNDPAFIIEKFFEETEKVKFAQKISPDELTLIPLLAKK
jgi:hypothetical protein